MSKLPNFQRALQKLLHKVIKKESSSAAKQLKESDIKLRRQSLMDFSVEDYYSRLLTSAPLLMTALFGSSCSQPLKKIQVARCSRVVFNELIYF